jgi:hypothetical protein
VFYFFTLFFSFRKHNARCGMVMVSVSEVKNRLWKGKRREDRPESRRRRPSDDDEEARKKQTSSRVNEESEREEK